MITTYEKRMCLDEYCRTNSCDGCPLNDLEECDCGTINVFRSVKSEGGFIIPDDMVIRAYDRVFPPTVEPSADPVNRPSHYTDGKIEVIDYIEDKKLGFCLGNAIKYISRAGKKDPTKEVEDLKKARWYIDRRIKEVEEGIV